jgi:hypothetical protein
MDAVDVVSAQLGRRPAIVFAVVVACPYGWPAVLRNSPSAPSGEPNPNIYYLSCPYLLKELSRLEDAGGVLELQKLLDRDQRLRQSVKEAQERHRSLWRSLAAGNDSLRGFEAPAIAGAGDEMHIKCLHAHYSFYLAQGGYLLGELIDGMLPGQWCGDDRCRRLLADFSKGG